MAFDADVVKKDQKKKKKLKQILKKVKDVSSIWKIPHIRRTITI